VYQNILLGSNLSKVSKMIKAISITNEKFMYKCSINY